MTPLDDQIRGISALISLTLALVVVFTNHRQDLARRRGAELRWRWRFVRAAVLDVLLFTLTLLTVIATASLAFDALGDADFPHRGGALRSLFGLVWIALVALLGWQVAIVVETLRPGVTTKGIPWRKPHDPPR
jgi:hypothetical protein